MKNALNREVMEQKGVIVLDDRMNKKAWSDEAKKEGYVVLDCGETLELYGKKKGQSNG